MDALNVAGILFYIFACGALTSIAMSLDRIAKHLKALNEQQKGKIDG